MLLDYINKTHRSDSVFAGLIFNSPFLGWGSADGQVEALADHVMARAIDAGDISAKLLGGSGKACKYMACWCLFFIFLKFTNIRFFVNNLY